MQSVKNVTTPTIDPVPFECTSARIDPDSDHDGADMLDDHDSEMPEEAGYGYGV
jgi:hypothetical protein